MKTRLLILTETMAPYRVPVFDALVAHPEIDLHVVFLSTIDQDRNPWGVDSTQFRFSWEVLPYRRRRVAGYHLLFNRGVSRALTRHRPDVVLCGGYNYQASWRALWWAASRRVPFVLWSESTALDSRRRFPTTERLKRFFVRSCDGVVVPGQAAADYMGTLGVPADRIGVAPNAVDIRRFAAAAASARAARSTTGSVLDLPPRFFLFVGRLSAEKGVFDLLEAYRALDPAIRTEYELVLVGAGPLRPALEARARSIQPGAVRFAGYVGQDVLPACYALASAFVLPSSSEVWGLVVNEAMACGAPVIVTRAAGCTRDLIVDGSTGLLVSPSNPTELAAALTRVATNPALARTLGEQAQHRIQQFSPEACAAGLADQAQAAFRRRWTKRPASRSIPPSIESSSAERR